MGVSPYQHVAIVRDEHLPPVYRGRVPCNTDRPETPDSATGISLIRNGLSERDATGERASPDIRASAATRPQEVNMLTRTRTLIASAATAGAVGLAASIAAPALAS